MSNPAVRPTRPAASLSLVVLVVLALSMGGCGAGTETSPRELLLSQEDFPEVQLTVLSESEAMSGEGPTALVELQGPGFRVLQSVLLFENRERALAALDGIRGDLISTAGTDPGGVERSDVLQHTLGEEAAASLFFIEDNGLVRLTVTGPERGQLLEELAEIAREKLAES